MSMLYYVEERIEETGKPPLEEFYETGTYETAYAFPYAVEYVPPSGVEWETATAEERKQIYLSGQGIWQVKPPRITGIEGVDLIIHDLVSSFTFGGIGIVIGIILALIFLIFVMGWRR